MGAVPRACPIPKSARVLWSSAVLFCLLSFGQEVSDRDRVVEALRAGRIDEAVSLADGWIAAAPGDPRPHTLKGIALATLGRTDEAVRAYVSALAIDESYLPALQGAAELELRLGRPQARSRLERILGLQPGNATAHAMLGVLAYAAKDCEEALKQFANGVEAVATDPEVMRQRAECLFSLGRFEAAALDFGRLLEDQPASADLRHNLGLSLLKAGSASEAVDALRPVASDPIRSDIETLSLLAEAQHAALETEGALDSLQRAIRAHPRSERLYIQLAELCIEHGAYELGLEVVEVGARNMPDSYGVLTMRGILLAELGRHDEAERAFQEAVVGDPSSQSAAIGLSLTLEKSGRLEESLEVLRARSNSAPDDAIARFYLAKALVRRGAGPESADYREALEGLSFAAKRLPEEAAPRVELGKLHLRAKRVEEAIKVLEEAVGIAPDNRQAVYNLMIAYRRSGRADEAASLARRVRAALEQSKDEEVRRNRLKLVRKPTPSSN